MDFRTERLNSDHDLDPFSSGHEVLDAWLRDHARTADAKGTGRTYVLVYRGGLVAGYYTLAPHVIRREALPKKIGRGSPNAIPAISLARLALDENFQRRGLGSTLLVNALTRAIEAMRAVGGRVIVVDAIDATAAAFYRHHDFRPLPNSPLRLVVKASDVAHTLKLPWP